MKRGLLVTVIVLSLIFILALSPVNAGWDDFWGKITGKTFSETCLGEATTTCSDYDDYVNSDDTECNAQGWACSWSYGPCDQVECINLPESKCDLVPGCSWVTFRASFTAIPEAGIETLEVTFDASDSVGDISLYHWDIGGIENRSGANMDTISEYTFFSPGTYIITLTITETGTGATHSATKNVLVTGCGDGNIEGLEVCDDGGSASGDGCTNLCAIEEGWTCSGTTSHCISSAGGCLGDLPLTFCQINYGKETIPMECDTSVNFPVSICESSSTGTTCNTIGDCEDLSDAMCEEDPFNTYCSLGTPCGNRILETEYGEECDDGNVVSGDGCDSACKEESGITQTEVSPERTMCTTGNKGLKCEETAAENYCLAREYNGYAENSKICDGTNHDTGNWADNEVSYTIGTCDATGSSEWVTELICYTVSAEACVDDDIDMENPLYHEGTTTKGSVTKTDSCAADGFKLTEWYCDSDGEIASMNKTCTTGCQNNACIVPAGGLYCPKNNGTDSPVPGLPKASSKSRDEATDGKLYYCGLDLHWTLALADDATCTADYECIANSCVEGECFAVRTELEAQAGLLRKIWCVISNIKDYITGDKDSYCECLLDHSNAFWDESAEQCDW